MTSLFSQVNTVLEDQGNIRNVNVQAHWEVMLSNLNRELNAELKETRTDLTEDPLYIKQK
jgi:hypothetical protein